MLKRATVLIGTIVGLIWSVAVVVAPGLGPQPFIPLNLALIYAFLPAGLFLMLVIAVRAARRARGASVPFAPGSRVEIDQRVLGDTVEQMVLALLIWPFAASWLGAVTVIAMGASMGIARLAYWLGAHASPGLRAFGFTASFCPTVLAFLWTVWKLAT